jgi:putative transposase
MSNTMDKRKLQAIANALAKDVKTPKDLSTLSVLLTELTAEATLKAEMDYLCYDKNNPSGHHSGNRRNGLSSKKLKSVSKGDEYA